VEDNHETFIIRGGRQTREDADGNVIFVSSATDANEFTVKENTSSTTAVDQLKASLKQLSRKIEDAKRKKNLLIARAKRAEAQKSIANTMSGMDENSEVYQ